MKKHIAMLLTMALGASLLVEPLSCREMAIAAEVTVAQEEKLTKNQEEELTNNRAEELLGEQLEKEADDQLEAKDGEPGKVLSNPKLRSDNAEATWDCVWLGHFWQEDTNGDGRADENDDMQPIKWRVLSVSANGEEALLISDKLLMERFFTTSKTNWERENGVTWGDSPLRSYLNGLGKAANQDSDDYSEYNFLNVAFTEAERSNILVSNNKTESNGTIPGGADTEDYVYIFSTADAKTKSYGFSNTVNKYGRAADETSYCEDQGKYRSQLLLGGEFGAYYSSLKWWWLRTPGTTKGCGTYVDDKGEIHGGMEVGLYTPYDIRPVMRYKLTNENWVYAGTYDTELGASEINRPSDIKSAYSHDDIMKIDPDRYHLAESSKPKVTPTPTPTGAPQPTNAPTYIPTPGIVQQAVAGYKIEYTENVTYNGVAHINKDGKASVSKAADIDLKVIDIASGEQISIDKYTVKFKNNKDTFAAKGKQPYFTIAIKGKTDRDTKAAFKATNFEFNIEPSDLGSLSLVPVIKASKSGTKIAKLSYINATGKKITLKPAKNGKGDYVIVEQDDNTFTIMGCNNYTGTAVLRK